MFRFALFSLAVSLMLAPAGSAQSSPARNGLNKTWMEIYARHLWALGPDFTVTVLDPKPSPELPGFKEIVIHVSQGEQGQDAKLLVSDDGTRIVEGSVYNAGANAYKKYLDKLKTQGAPSLGTPGATVVIVEFSDFQCPHCKEQAKTLRDNLIENYPKQVHFYFKEFPLESIHDWAKSGAVAGRCVLRQSPAAFWEYHDWVFAHQDGFSKTNLKDQIMQWAGNRKELDTLQLGRCIDDQATAKEVEANIEQARALEVDGTPTLFINGRKLPAGAIDWQYLKRCIDSELDYQAKAKDAGEDVKPEAPARTAPAAPSARKQ